MFVVFDRLWYNAFLFKEDWGRMRIGIVRLSAFGDVVIANAIIDRLVHHCEIIKITGNSYRLKGKNIYDDNLEI